MKVYLCGHCKDMCYMQLGQALLNVYYILLWK